ncbi:MAG: metal-dependent hydrolase [Halobacteriales archaeon]
MWPWGHLAVGYIAYATWTRYRDDDHPTAAPVVALTVATQLPDLVDKPLAYSVGVLPEGRSLAHSLLVAVPLCLLALELARRASGWRARCGVAAAVGYATHLLGDSLHGLLGLDAAELTFLAFPLLAPPDYDTTSFGEHVAQFVGSVESLGAGGLSPFLVQWILFALMVLLWLSHRAPPLGETVTALRRWNANRA